VCLDPAGDPDGDGLTSARERAIGTHPLDPDSDNDGRSDGEEVGTGATPRDSDGDGRIDALEDDGADTDGDCVPDPFDPADDDPDQPAPDVLRALFCRGAGVCREAAAALRVRCDRGVPRCDYVDVPGFEYEERSCDGRDNDCDGHTDEGLLLDGAPVGAACPARGVCAAGLVECGAATGTPVCSTRADGSASQARDELCNGLDDDCDGRTDEDLGTAEGLPLGAACNGRGACGAGVVECLVSAGVAHCSTEGGGSADQTAPEVCDAVDNDCDGETDEGLVSPGDGCATTGVCVAAGDSVQRRCQLGGWFCDYAGVPGWEPGEESICDGLDNDCDGETDERFVFVDFDGIPRRLGAPCGTGACAGGVVVCAADGRGATCSTLSAATAETCNGRDDDCDGQTDENQLYNGKLPGQACDGVGACGAGVVECSPSGAATCSTNPDGSAPEHVPETCDGRDEDCDGTTDEDVGDPPRPCAAPGVCAGESAPAACLSGEWVCDWSAVPGFEPGVERSCDGRDNNCNGQVDEPFPKTFGDRFVLVAEGSPPVRAAAAVGLDPTDGRLLLFGGRAGGGADVLLADLWARDRATDTWELLADGSAPDAPPPMAGATLLSDAAGGQVLLVGGTAQAGAGRAPGRDVWAWRPATGSWARITPASAAPAELAAVDAAAFDPETRTLWAWGRTAEDGGALARLALSEEPPTWAAVTPAGLPALIGAALIWDGAGARLLAVAGVGADGVPRATTVVVPLDRPGGAPTAASLLAAAPLPPPRSGHAAALDADRGRLLVVGGRDADGTALDDAWTLDLDTLAWTTLPAAEPGPPARSDAALVVVGENAYLVGGHDDAGRPDRTLWALSLTDDSWGVAALPGRPPPLADAAAAFDPSARRWYVAGGRTPTVDGEALSAEVWAWDVAAGRWERIGDPLEPGGQGRAAAVLVVDAPRRRLLLHGGFVAADGAAPAGSEAPTDSLVVLELPAARWSRPAVQGTPPPPVAAHAAVLVPGAGRALVVGGVTPGGPGSAAWQLDLARLEWAPLPAGSAPPPALRHAAALWHAGTAAMLVVGGHGGSGEILRYTPATAEWSVVTADPLLAASDPVAWLDALSDTLLVGVWPGGAGHPTFLRVTAGATQAVELGAPLPSGLRAAAFAHDPSDRRAWLYGGRDGEGRIRDELWALDEVCPE
jgi:hypothetical protein